MLEARGAGARPPGRGRAPAAAGEGRVGDHDIEAMLREIYEANVEEWTAGA